MVGECGSKLPPPQGVPSNGKLRRLSARASPLSFLLHPLLPSRFIPLE